MLRKIARWIVVACLPGADLFCYHGGVRKGTRLPEQGDRVTKVQQQRVVAFDCISYLALSYVDVSSATCLNRSATCLPSTIAASPLEADRVGGLQQ